MGFNYYFQLIKIAERYGRKISLITLAVPQMIGWILIYFARNPIFLIAARFLHGFAGELLTKYFLCKALFLYSLFAGGGEQC